MSELGRKLTKRTGRYRPVADIAATWHFARMRLAPLLVVAFASWGSAALAVSPFVIFFASGSTRPDAPARYALNNALTALRVNAVNQIEIEGDADRVGSSEFNQRLSRLRAQAVADYLKQGGYAGSVRIIPHGEEQPLVATADGVAESQNRRAEIIMVCFPNPQPGFEYMQCPPTGNGK